MLIIEKLRCDMSLMKERKKCPLCGRDYNFNPDLGKGIVCPHCKETENNLKKRVEKIRMVDFASRT